MEEAIFVDGAPRQITVADIRRWHLMAFPRLADDDKTPIIEEAIDAVYAMFTGLPTFYDHLPKQIWYTKTLFLARMLCCWYIANQYPLYLSGQSAMGGVPLKSKKIGPITLTYADGESSGGENYQDILSALKSNSFGILAYTMVRGSTKRLRIGGKTRI